MRSSSWNKVDLVSARGKFGAKTDRTFWLKRFESTCRGSHEDDSEQVVRGCCEALMLSVAEKFVEALLFNFAFAEDDPRDPWAKSGLCTPLLLARLRMKDWRFSSSERSSLTLSLRATILIVLLRIPLRL